MKRILMTMAAATTLAAIAASPALADSGSVTVNGTVTGTCTVQGAAPQATINVGELDVPTTGLVVSGFGGANTASFKVVCNTAAPKIAVSATALTGPASPPTGYTNVVNYKATVTPSLATGTFAGTAPFYDTASATSHTETLASPLANPSLGDNILVTVSAPSTPTPTNILVAGAYQGTVTVTVTPS